MVSSLGTLGIILAAGKSSRLYPATLATTKQLVPVYDKPMIYFPLSTLMLAGVKDVLLITNKDEQEVFQKLLGDGSELGMRFDYLVQEKPEGIAQALTITNEYLALYDSQGLSPFRFDGDLYNSVFLILGDNLFHGSGLSATFKEAVSNCERYQNAQTFFQRVKDPHRFGVGEFNARGVLVGIEEKPTNPKSDWISVGAYIYPMNTPNDGLLAAGDLEPSKRGELEITDLNNTYLKNQTMVGYKFPRGTAWFDCGTYDSLMEAAGYVKAIQNSQGMMVASPHEIAWNSEFIGDVEVMKFIERTGGATKNAYNEYLYSMVKRGRNNP